MVVNRETLAAGIETMLMDFGYWGGAHADGSTFRYLLWVIKRGYFGMTVPAVSFKTDQNMHRKTPHDVASKTRALPHWGNSHDLMRRYM
jgi:adenosylmethionine-8-amino-7-oxononanoate aminotransferase